VSDAAIRRILATDTGVIDFAITACHAAVGERMVAYVVPGDGFSVSHLRERLALATKAGAIAIVPISRIPLLASGSVDLAQLATVPAFVEGELPAEMMPDGLRGRIALEPLTWPDRTSRPHTSTAPSKPAAEISIPLGVRTPSAATQRGVGPLAIASGPSLLAGQTGVKSLAEALARTATAHPEHGIRYLKLDGTETFQTYASLWSEARCVAQGLRASGVRPASVVALFLESASDVVPAFWGCIAAGAVPLPLPMSHRSADDSLARRTLEACQGLPDVSLVFNPTGSETPPEIDGVRNLSLEDLRASPDALATPGSLDDPTLLLLTSGSTSVPKRVIQTHRALLAQAIGSAAANGFQPDDVSLNWFPLDHVGGLVMYHLRDLVVGCQQIQAPTTAVLREPLTWLEWMERYRATASWGPNFAYALIVDQLVRQPARRFDLSRVRFLLNGGEAIVSAQARKFLQELESSGLRADSMVPAWGMSETCSGVTYSHEFRLTSTSDDDPFVDLGTPIPGFSIRIVDSAGNVVTEGDLGQVEVSGPQVTKGYYLNAEATADAFSPDGWFRTGDTGLLRSGRLTLTGRQKEVLIINGQNFSAHQIEAEVDSVPGVLPSYTAAFAVRHAGDATDQAVVTLCSDTPGHFAGTRLIKVVREHLVSAFGWNPWAVLVLPPERVPKTSIGKIPRATLRQMFENGDLHDAVGGFPKPDSLFRERTWVRRALPSARTAQGTDGVVVIYSAPTTFAAAVASELRSQGRRVVCVQNAPGFERSGTDLFLIDPAQLAHHRRIFVGLQKEDIRSGDLLLVQQDLPSELSFVSLVLLAAQAAIGVWGPAQSAGVMALTGGVLAIEGFEATFDAAASLSGLLRSISRERPTWRCRHVDIDESLGNASAHRIRDELLWQDKESLVAYRNESRLVMRQRQVDRSGTHNLVPDASGFYVVTGGMGGVGRELVAHLKKLGFRMLILGRSPLPSVGEWTDELGAFAQRLAALPGEVRYAVADVRSPEALRSAVAAAEQSWGLTLTGAFHLAGTLEEGQISRLTPERMNNALQTKLAGAETLRSMLEVRGGGHLVLFSSALALLGGAGRGAYAAASSALDEYARIKSTVTVPIHSLGWSAWRELGLSEGGQEDVAESRGFLTLDADDALLAMDAALSMPAGAFYVGLVAGNAQVAATSDDPLRVLTEAVVRVHGGSAPSLEIADVCGRRFVCATLPEGDPSSGTDTAQSRAAVDTELVGAIATIWQEVLRLPSVPFNRGFLELGGNSLLIPQVQQRLKKTFQVEPTLAQLFRHSTVEDLARLVSALRSDGPQ
jgi:acyl-CoA synthetase (AMP-forming)/AMP-acid ligase II